MTIKRWTGLIPRALREVLGEQQCVEFEALLREKGYRIQTQKEKSMKQQCKHKHPENNIIQGILPLWCSDCGAIGTPYANRDSINWRKPTNTACRPLDVENLAEYLCKYIDELIFVETEGSKRVYTMLKPKIKQAINDYLKETSKDV